MAIEKWVITPGESRVIDFELVRKLKVSLIGGKVDVIAHDEPGARIEISGVTGKDLMVSIDGDILEIDHPQLRWDNFIDAFKGFVGSAKAEVSILAPRHVAMKLGVISGDALVSGFTTDAKFSTVSGDVVIDNHEGDVELSSVSGEISAGNHTGRITAHSVSGDIVATGDIVSFNADTVSGSMIVDAYGTPDRVDTNTVSGDLTVRFEPGSGARYRINTVGGTVLLDDMTIKGMLGKGFERVVGELVGPLARARRQQRLGQHLDHASRGAGEARARRMPRPARARATARPRHDPAGLRTRQPAPLPARAARGAAPPRLRAHPGALRPVRRHLQPERGHDLSAPLEARGGGPGDEVDRRAQDRLRDHGAGSAELDSRRHELDAIEDDLTDSVRRLADGVRAEVNDAMRSLRAELASAAREAKRAATSTSASGAGATSAGGTTSPHVESNRAVHEADIVLNEFRQQLRTDLRTHAHRGLVNSESVSVLKARLAQVRADVLATLAASE